MKTLQSIAITVLFGHMITAASRAENEDLAKTVGFYGTEIKKALDAEKWLVSVNPASIVIESKFEVGIARRVSPALGAKPDLKKYRIELRFDPRLPKAAYIELAKKRIEHAAIVNYGAKTKTEWSNALKFLRKYPLPRYDVMDRVGKPYSVYLLTTDSIAISIVPAEKYAEVKGAEATIDQILWPHAH